jgi:pyrroline-5-carboxylate reductase
MSLQKDISSKLCTYLGLGHMGLPVFRATHKHFIESGWYVKAVDFDKNRRELAFNNNSNVTISDSPSTVSTITFLGIRPQDFYKDTNLGIRSDIVVSMMAGVTVSSLQEAFPDAVVVRIIPNTPCEFGAGITPIFSNDYNLSNPKISTLHTALSKCGFLLPVPHEEMIDWATGVSAGGPAYIMHIADAMIESACHLGFSKSEARLLVGHTIEGSAKMLLETTETPDVLARQVMTPNGTTERGMNVLREQNVHQAVNSALQAASNRAEVLSKAELENT